MSDRRATQACGSSFGAGRGSEQPMSRTGSWVVVQGEKRAWSEGEQPTSYAGSWVVVRGEVTGWERKRATNEPGSWEPHWSSFEVKSRRSMMGTHWGVMLV